MGLKEEIEDMKKEVKNIQEHSFAMELLKDSRKTNKRMFIIIIVLLSFWFSTIGAFIYYISNYGYEITTETAETSDSGNACIGDNCINGDSNTN